MECLLQRRGTVPTGGLLRWKGPSPAGKFSPERVDSAQLLQIERFMGTFLRGFMNGHPCIGARTLAANYEFYYAVYPDMRTVDTARKLLEDIDQYYRLSDDLDEIVKSMLCVFTEEVRSPEHFANMFWDFMQVTHDLDSLTHQYDQSVSSNPAESSFELSFRGRAAFPTTLHGNSPRSARKFAYAGWALNQSSQFNALRKAGKFEDWKRKIRTADKGFDPSGQSNPLLVDHGEASPVAQLGGAELPSYNFKARSTEDRAVVANNLLARAISESAGDDTLEYLKGIVTSLR